MLLIPFLLTIMPAFAGKVPDLSDGKDLGKYLEAQTLFGSGSFKRYPMSEREFVLMD